MFILKKFLFILIVGMSFSAHFTYADIELHVKMIDKKGINKGLVLVSELHSLEKIISHNPIVLQMKNGHKVQFKASFVKNKNFHGPSSTILIKGLFFNKNQSEGVKFSDAGIKVELNSEKDIELKNSGDQVLLLRVSPRIL